MKLTINKLIANDMINYGMDKTSGLNYIIYLDTYLEDFEKEDQKYIKDNLDTIINDIRENENVADLEVRDEDNTKVIDMVFYWGKLLNTVEKKIDDTARILGVKIDYEEIKEMADDILDDDEFNDDLISKLKYYNSEKDID